MPDFTGVVEVIGKAIDFAGIAAMVGGTILATGFYVRRLTRGVEAREAYRTYRQGIGRAILLGLELLVAGDIIRTVAITPTFASVGVLALIVVVRTFLSFSLEIELNDRLPWQPLKPAPPKPDTSSRS